MAPNCPETTMSKNDWDAALDEWVTEERERLGGPPEPEEVVAFLRGELPEADAARVQALLVYYHELTSLLDEKLERKRPATRWLPVAASLLIAVVAIIQLTQSRRKPQQPYVMATKHELRSVLMRGETRPAPPYVLPDNETQYRLAPVLSDPPRDPAYRLELVYLSDATPRRVWISGLVQPPFEIVVPREFLGDGLYQLNVLGVDGARTHVVEQFRFRTPQDRGDQSISGALRRSKPRLTDTAAHVPQGAAINAAGRAGTQGPAISAAGRAGTPQNRGGGIFSTK
jgi:hypothetical protein